jgi:hypothetical protein
MKTIVKLLVAAVVVNAAARLGMSTWTQYQFRDTMQQVVLFGAAQSIAEL